MFDISLNRLNFKVNDNKPNKANFVKKGLYNKGFGSLKLKPSLSNDVVSFKNHSFKSDVEPYTEKMNLIRSFCQYNEELPEEGISHCGPTSASNTIMYLAENGYSNLTNGKSQLEVIKELGDCCNTDTDGTTTTNVCKGLEKFVKSKGYKVKNIEYQGIRDVKDYKKGVKYPDIDRIKEAIEKPGIVLLNIGAYKLKNKDGNPFYIRNEGHWITLVGHSYDGSKANKDFLIVHDPVIESTVENKNRFIKLDQLTEGKLLAGKDDVENGLPCAAKGYNKISQGLEHLHKEKIKVLDGVVILELEKPGL